MSVTFKQLADELEEKKLIKLKEVIQITGLSHHTIYKYVNNGKFPKCIKFGECNLWDYGEVKGWATERAALKASKKKDRKFNVFKSTSETEYQLDIQPQDISACIDDYLASGGRIKYIKSKCVPFAVNLCGHGRFLNL